MKVPDYVEQEAKQFWNSARSEQISKYFEIRTALNTEKIVFLKNHKPFIAELRKIKKGFKIPTLDPTLDIQGFDISPNEMSSKSVWLESSSDITKDQFRNEIQALISKYKLPSYWDEWLEGSILYGVVFEYAPLFSVHEITNEKLSNLSLTSQEKSFLRSYYKRYYTKGKVPKKIYQLFKQALNKAPTNKQRRSRSLKTAVATLKHGKARNTYDWATQRLIKGKVSHKDLVAKIFNSKYESKVGTDKLANRLRKQKQRLLERNKLKK